MRGILICSAIAIAIGVWGCVAEDERPTDETETEQMQLGLGSGSSSSSTSTGAGASVPVYKEVDTDGNFNPFVAGCAMQEDTAGSCDPGLLRDVDTCNGYDLWLTENWVGQDDDDCDLDDPSGTACGAQYCGQKAVYCPDACYERWGWALPNIKGYCEDVVISCGWLDPVPAGRCACTL